MDQNVMSKINYFVFYIIIFALMFCVPYAVGHAQTKNNSTSPAQNEIEITDSGDAGDAVSIAVKGISLTQGEGGQETWRLNATSAKMDQESGVVSVQAPNITYFLKNNKQELHIKSKQGTIEQNQSIVELWGDVRVDEADNLLTTSKALYEGGTHILTLPEPLDFFNPMFLGKANSANWDLNTNIFKASGDINVTIISQKKHKK